MTRGLNRDDSCWHCGGAHFTSECASVDPPSLICHGCGAKDAYRNQDGSIRRCAAGRALCADCDCTGEGCTGVLSSTAIKHRDGPKPADEFAARMQRRRAEKHLPTKDAIKELRMARVQAMLGPNKAISPMAPTDVLQEPLCLGLCPWDEETPCARPEGHTGMHYGLNGSAWPGMR